jgi:t-SNARE complex subunit (syntaxin)
LGRWEGCGCKSNRKDGGKKRKPHVFVVFVVFVVVVVVVV